MNRDDHGQPESEEDLENIRRRNSERRRHKPESPTTLGDADHGVRADRDGSGQEAASGDLDSQETKKDAGGG